jgi:hypothetical protein
MFFGCRGRLVALLMVPVVLFLASCGIFHTTSAPAVMGREVVDGKFAFIVNEVGTSPTFGQTRAGGIYVIVSMAVRNVGTAAHLFEVAAQKLKENDGRGHSASFVEPIVNNIDPGLQVSVKLAFDVPPGLRQTQILLHESESSHGTPVNLVVPRSPSPSSG